MRRAPAVRQRLFGQRGADDRSTVKVMVLVGAMVTPDGRWRVEAHRERRQDWYRVLHDGVVHVHEGHACERVVLGTVQAVLAEAGVDLGELVPVDG